jgi:hypothetical protein
VAIITLPGLAAFLTGFGNIDDITLNMDVIAKVLSSLSLSLYNYTHHVQEEDHLYRAVLE